MSDSLFSSLLLADAASSEATASGVASFDAGLTQLLTLTRDPAGLNAPVDAALAAAISDVVHGQSIVLKLRPSLPHADRLAAKALLEQLIKVSGTLDKRRQEEAIATLANVILPDRLADARGMLAADNLELRDRFIADLPSITGLQVGEQAGLKSRNPYATAARWKASGDIFSVQHRGTERFPTFQFKEARPHPSIKKVLRILPDHLSPWQRAFWFASTNGWLDGDAPMDRLDETDLLIAAARHESEDFVG